MYISDFFYIWKANRMTLFCNLFMERPSYVCALWVIIQKLYSPPGSDADGLYCFRPIFVFSVTMITHEPLHSVR